MDDALNFAAELEDVALQLSSLDPMPEDPATIANIANQVIAEYERLSMSAAMFGMNEIQQTTDWILGLLNSFRDTIPEAVLELLQAGQVFSWIELAASVLRDPDDISLLPAINDSLLDETWPEPIDPTLLGNLLVSLRMSGTANVPTTNFMFHDGLNNDDTPVTASQETIPPIDNGLPKLAWDEDVHPELLEAYLQETPGQVTEAAKLIRSIAQGHSTPEQKRHAARLAHTIKGASGVVGVEAIAQFTHKLEDILELDIRKQLQQGLGETLNAAADGLESLFDCLQEHQPLPTEYATLMAEMQHWEQVLNAQHVAFESPLEATATDEPDVGLPTQPIVLPDFITQNTLDADEDAPLADTPRSSATHLSVPVETIQRLLNFAGELITSTSQIADYVQRTVALGRQIQSQDDQVRQMLDELSEAIDQQSMRAGRHAAKQTQSSSLDQLELEAYNDLQSSSGLLTEAIADNRELGRNLQQQIRLISDQVYSQQRLQRQLSETILQTRLIPVQSVTTRMERTVRETCRRTGKQANIRFHGQNLQVDTDILQGLTPPLLHMLRNAVDHGIETPEERVAAGKTAEGLIELRIEQKGSQIHMTLSDDGRGLAIDRIRQRGIEKGLVKPEQTLTDDEILRLILQPGFSTRDQVSDISGRGVGMDVVQTAVEDLQGILNLTSKAGQGTTIHIQVPLTLIATNALLVKAGEHMVAIPGNTIQQLLYVAADEHIQDNEQWFIEYQLERLPVIPLAQLLGWVHDKPDVSKGHSLLLIASENKHHVLYVDEIQQPRDIVIKSLSPWINISAHGISGACILANGAVAPVLDVLRLLRNFDQGLSKRNAVRPLGREKTAERARILVVDDSLSNRKSVSLMLEQMGYHAITAVDGLDALQRLHEQNIELILTDLEMPRMNGLEMTQAIRIWPEKEHLPVIMITSRSTQKHRQMAQQAGIDDYLTKPVDYETLHTHIQKWLRTQLAD